MMRTVTFAFLSITIFACSNNETEENNTAPLPANIENVNGNIPDTSSGTTLNTPMEVDSLQTDTLRR